jgi:DNA repair protein RadC
MKIKDTPLIERPREKLLRYGVERLSLVELLAVILGTGQKQYDALELASRILRKIKVQDLANLNLEQLIKYSGVGISKACSILAALELGKRLLDGKKSQLLLNPADVWSHLQDIRELRKEHFVVFFLDIRNQVVKREVISIGTLNASLVHPREVFEPAIREGAAQIILSHNHPSGIVEPSEEDISLTSRLIEVGKILGIEVIDHIIVSKLHYFSFKSRQLL